MSIYVILNVLFMLALVFVLYKQQQKFVSFTRRVFVALGLGVAYGVVLQLLYGSESEIVQTSIQYFDIMGVGYVKLLQMIVIPLIMVSIITAIIKLKDGKSLGKISGLTISILIATTVVSALIGIAVTHLFGLTAEGLTSGAREVARGDMLVNTLGTVQQLSFPKMIIEFIPGNPFLDMTGGRKTSTIAVVIFSVFVGLAILGAGKKKPAEAEMFSNGMMACYAIVMRMVTMVLRLTPYGVLALMTKVVSGSNVADILNLINFVFASYAGMAAIFAVHLALIAFVGLNPFVYVKKIFPTLVFAFTSRSSAGTIPMNVQTQVQKLGVSDGIANFSASFGSTIGQNGCAGLYPAMLATMIAPTMGINPMDIDFILTLLAITAISSFGVAGVGGGATFAALIVLSAMNMPVALAGLLISIEPLIDMGRTALNVSGSMTAGSVTSRLMGETDMAIYNSDIDDSDKHEDSLA